MPTPPQRGTGFVNLNQWRGLNQGSANTMGSALADDVDGRQQQIQQDFSGGMERFNSDVANGTQGGVGQPRQYTGPTSLDKYLDKGALLSRGADVASRGLAGGTNEGRATLLREKYGGNTWGGGALDGALAGAGSAGSRLDTQAQNAKGGFSSLQRYLGGADAAAQARVSGAQQAATDYNTQAQAADRASFQQRAPADEQRPPKRERNTRYAYP
jgi:hypothetical protein